MAKRQLLMAEHRSRFLSLVSSRMPLETQHVPLRMRHMAREILHKTRGLVVSSSMALSTAIVAMQASGDFGTDSDEVSLLQAVLRYSEQYQLPPSEVMQLITEEESLDSQKPD